MLTVGIAGIYAAATKAQEVAPTARPAFLVERAAQVATGFELHIRHQVEEIARGYEVAKGSKVISDWFPQNSLDIDRAIMGVYRPLGARLAAGMVEVIRHRLDLIALP